MKKTITILPQNEQFPSLPGQSLLESLIANGIFLRADCGGKGKCGKCQVRKISGCAASESVPSCTCLPEESITIEIPEASLLSSQVMDKAPLSFPDSFKDRFKETHEDDKCLGIAVDLGTTTIAVYLCHTSTGKVLASTSLKNPQAIYGDDVVSRIGAINEDPDKLERLQKLAVKSIEWGVRQVLSSENLAEPPVSGMVVVGNPTMIHILAGVDPKSIGMAPYNPAFYEALQFKSHELGFGLNEFTVHTLPHISGFLGGDILAAALAADLANQPDGTLLIDLGTNGELVLKNNGAFFATSCATGPAFEGASLSCGMQGLPGAIDSIEIGEDQKVCKLSVIRHPQLKQTSPAGICGPGVINAVAQLVAKGIVAPGGAFQTGQSAYTLVPEDPSNGQPAICITQKDIRSVQLGKSALITGIEFLLKKAGIAQPEKIIVAGAFGAHVQKKDLLKLGMIPAIDPEKILLFGNAAGSGAIMALCDRSYVEKAALLAEKTDVEDLTCNMDFQSAFIQNLSLGSL